MGQEQELAPVEPDLQRDPLSPAPRAVEGPGRRAREQARVGLYVHVPFCSVRCTYCDFSSGSLSAAALARYVDALEREIALRAPGATGTRFHSVFFGGGTPSVLPARAFRRVARALRASFDVAPDAEFTLEANPETVRPSLLEAWREAGVNRLSMGAQSFVPEELAALGRIHSCGRPAEAVALARAHGFERLSLDLMFGFPGHTGERWERTLEAALALDPGHLSAYCFIPEPGTPLGNAVLRREAPLPSAAEQAEGYARLGETLASAGYGCYETSNFCRPEREARHNLVYWLRRPYLGLGPSAHGLWDGVRYGNAFALEAWATALERGEDPASEREPEDERTAALERMMLGLRLSNGLDPRDHPAGAWATLERRYRAAFERACATGRLERADGGWRIPRRLRFVADDVIAWIEARAERARVDTPEPLPIMAGPCPSPPSPAA